MGQLTRQLCLWALLLPVLVSILDLMVEFDSPEAAKAAFDAFQEERGFARQVIQRRGELDASSDLEMSDTGARQRDQHGRGIEDGHYTGEDYLRIVQLIREQPPASQRAAQAAGPGRSAADPLGARQQRINGTRTHINAVKERQRAAQEARNEDAAVRFAVGDAVVVHGNPKAALPLGAARNLLGVVHQAYAAGTYTVQTAAGILKGRLHSSQLTPLSTRPADAAAWPRHAVTMKAALLVAAGVALGQAACACGHDGNDDEWGSGSDGGTVSGSGSGGGAPPPAAGGASGAQPAARPGRRAPPAAGVWPPDRAAAHLEKMEAANPDHPLFESVRVDAYTFMQCVYEQEENIHMPAGLFAAPVHHLEDYSEVLDRDTFRSLGFGQQLDDAAINMGLASIYDLTEGPGRVLVVPAAAYAAAFATSRSPRSSLLRTVFQATQRRMEALGCPDLLPDTSAVQGIVIPVHHEQHWVLIAVDLPARRITLFDSLPTFEMDREAHLTYAQGCVTTWVDASFPDDPITRDKPWTRKVRSADPPQQNGYDCGVWILEVASHLSAIPLIEIDPPSAAEECMDLARVSFTCDIITHAERIMLH
ncbi:hypothetical protein Rsub_07436 [Raphidocelis subcapitata]|uniref:Ubiquitin-like protease family profile domain-containing protein n=1 Tax=Raphidocelis subcapitata TaxID=307507 RepID=A0A2V0PA16_9CHLO|nr:hypothetical protein Rsub_07436 [Raphidocelis subcapitata]|eukprot:GBF94700.1 hypothetical protein Rsub_07436 [Raphidocelis subcapitata]